MNLLERLHGEVGRIILRVAAAAKRLWLQVQHPDHREHLAIAFNVFSKGRPIGEKILRRIVAQHHHVGAVLLFRVGPHAALR